MCVLLQNLKQFMETLRLEDRNALLFYSFKADYTDEVAIDYSIKFQPDRSYANLLLSRVLPVWTLAAGPK
jgi:hypothetical protein